MTSQKIVVVGGVTYVRSRDAARVVQLAPDYVSRLARAALIDGRLVEGLWFVNVATLEKFVADQEHQKTVWRAQLAQQRREEQRLAGYPAAFA